MSPAAWQVLGPVDREGLAEARLQSHHALQPATRLARAFVPPQSDDSHTNYGWNAEAAALLGREIATPGGPLRAGLRPADLTFLLEPGQGEFPLNGRTLGELNNWLRTRVAELGLDPAAIGRPLHFEIPGHPVAGGAAFRTTSATAEMARYYHNAALALGRVALVHRGSEVRCWPHHFDIATLIRLDGDRSIGAGLSPGDDSYPEPYFYVSPWPHPESGRLPAAPGGMRWHTDVWTGLVLTASELVARSSAESWLAAALDEAVATCRELLE